jgi:hypothetical protein
VNRQPLAKEVGLVFRKWAFMLGIAAVLLTTGCRDNTKVVGVDPPPHKVDGVYSITGDQEVTIYWRANQESDIDHYKIYRNLASTGTFTLIGTSTGTSFIDSNVTNGVTYYYALAAVDASGQESPELSIENVFDTPRPEGFGVTLTNTNVNDALSGFRFSDHTRRPSGDPGTDIYYSSASGSHLIVAATGTEIQDAGYVAIRDVDFAPPAGWSTDGLVEAIAGHSYIVLTRDNHYAKIEVSSPGASSVMIDWAYQVDPNNPELARKLP